MDDSIKLSLGEYIQTISLCNFCNPSFLIIFSDFGVWFSFFVNSSLNIKFYNINLNLNSVFNLLKRGDKHIQMIHKKSVKVYSIDD